MDFRFGIKNKPFFDVTDATFGADPTGANDSTAAIQAAINAASSSGTPVKEVFLPAGTYLVSSLTIAQANVHIRGTKMGAAIL
ncbi:MAG: glycosyl hydrolase family 28-related protein, partial [Aliidongia sp.]